jgi:hypothetical protein
MGWNGLPDLAWHEVVTSSESAVTGGASSIATFLRNDVRTKQLLVRHPATRPAIPGHAPQPPGGCEPYQKRDHDRGSVFGMTSLLPAGSTPIVIDDQAQVEQILRSHFGYGIEECHRALEAGHARAALATDNSAASQFGSDFYFGVVEQLRADLARYRYKAFRYRGLELARRRDNRLQVTTCMATDGAGEVSGEPNPKNPKGSSSRKAIHNNQGSLGMLAPGEAWDPIETWWHLYQLHGDSHSRSITGEVSLPNYMGSPKVFGWGIRLILPILHLNEALPPALPEPAVDIEVPIVRRVG